MAKCDEMLKSEKTQPTTYPTYYFLCNGATYIYLLWNWLSIPHISVQRFINFHYVVHFKLIAPTIIRTNVKLLFFKPRKSWVLETTISETSSFYIKSRWSSISKYVYCYIIYISFKNHLSWFWFSNLSGAMYVPLTCPTIRYNSTANIYNWKCIIVVHSLY